MNASSNKGVVSGTISDGKYKIAICTPSNIYV